MLFSLLKLSLFSRLTYIDVNTEIENMKDAVIKMIKAGHPVFFGCDVGKFSDSAKGIMDTALYEYEVRCPPAYLLFSIY